jgi:hypothetical protein
MKSACLALTKLKCLHQKPRQTHTRLFLQHPLQLVQGQRVSKNKGAQIKRGPQLEEHDLYKATCVREPPKECKTHLKLGALVN